MVPSEVCAATVIANDWSTRASSSIAIAYASVSEAALAVELFGDWPDDALGELAHGRAEEPVLVGEVVVGHADIDLASSVSRRTP
jgi:hypothetical protein